MTTPEDTLRQAAETSWDDFYARIESLAEGGILSDEAAFFEAVRSIKTFKSFTTATLAMLEKLGSPERGGATKNELLDTLHRTLSIASFVGWKIAQAQQETVQLESLLGSTPSAQPETGFNVT